MKHRLRDRNLKIVDKNDTVQEDPYRLSIHSSTNINKSDSGSKRLNLSRMLENSRKKISMRKANELFQSGVRPHSSKVIKRNEVIEFDNMKWISIISAYDPTRLKNVSVSKKTCQKFLQTQGQNIKTDSRSLLYFNDLIKNFKSWLNKIHIQYFYIMENFLYGKRSVNITLADLKPKIDEVINQTSHMQQNLQNCLKSYENHEFRQLLRKYHVYLENSKQIEDIIMIVNKSKTKIVELYKKFDDDKKIEEKLNRVKNDGIHQVKKIICEHNEIQIQNQIMDRIQTAINEMAEKSGEAYRKIRGIKQLISRFKNTENQSGQVMQKLDMESINLMGKVCREICFEADAFDAFSSKFLTEGDIINDDLKNIIRKYEEDMAIERKRAIELQMKFLNIILSETTKKLKENSKICVVYQNAEAHHEEYKRVLRMIQDVADCLIDQNKKVTLEKLIKQTKTVFDRLYDELKYLKENKKFEQIDTEEGLISILEVSKLIKEYKDKILLVRKKFQSTHRQMIMTPIKIEQITQDKETDFINAVISLSKKINNSNLKDRIQHVPCFSPVQSKTGLIKMSEQIQEENILEDIKTISNEFLELQQQNTLQQFFGSLKLEDLIFKESIVMLNLKKLSSKTQEKNIIPQLTDLLKKRNEWVEKHKKISPQMKRYFERILASTLVKGLKQQDIKELQNPRSIPFPTKENQIQPLRNKVKYRQVLLHLIENSLVQTTKSFQSEANDREEPKNKSNFFVSEILQKNITNINNFISSFTKITQIKKNINSESFLAKEYLIEFSEKLFSMICLKRIVNEGNNGYDQQKIQDSIKSLIKICNDRVLSLTRAILSEENDWRLIESKKDLSNFIGTQKIPVHVQKVIELLEFYKSKTTQLSDSCIQALQTFNKSTQNVDNPRQIVEEFSKLSLYAKVLVSVVKYCKQTQQIIHVILDNAKSPIALINPKENFLKQIFPGLKKGKQLTLAQIQKLTLTIPKIGIELKSKKAKGQDFQQASNKSKKPIKKDLSIMDEDILEASSTSMKESMVDEIPDGDVEEIDDYDEQMPEDQMGEEVDQEPQEMVEDFEAPEDEVGDKIEEENLQDLIEESQNLGKSKNKIKSKNQIDDFEEYQWQENDQDIKNQNKKLEEEQRSKQQKAKEQEQKKKKQLQTKKKQEQQRKAKQKEEQQKQKRMKKQHIVFSQTQLPKKIIQHSVYEVLGFITSLYQLKTLIYYMHSFEQTFMNNVIQWSKIQQYFNNHYILSQIQTKESQEKAKKEVQKYMKTIDELVDSKLKKDFQTEPSVFNEIKGLETVKQLKKNLLLLKNSNWQTLQKMLSANYVTYNVLKSDKSVLYIFIKDLSLEYDEYGAIDGYLSKNFKYYKRTKFDIKSFAEKCFSHLKTSGTKAESFQIVTYVAKSQRSLISNPKDMQNNYEEIKLIFQNFSNGAKDHVNKFDLCLDLYKKALQLKQKVQIDLNWYSDQIKFIQKLGTEESDILSYVIFIKDNIKNVIKKIKSLESKLYNLSFKCERKNIFECFEEITELYGDEIENKLVLNKGQTKFTGLVFDKTNSKENFNRIKKILSSEPTSKQSHAEKIILSLLLGNDGQIPKQIDENSILQNSKKLTVKQPEFLLEILCTLRVNHSYILIREKSLDFFTLRKQKDECISNFIMKMTNSLLENKSLSALITKNSCFSSLKSLQNLGDNSLYHKIFTPSIIKTLFKENIKESTHLKQIQVMVSQENFNLSNKNWNEDSQKIINEISGCLQNSKKQSQTLLDNMTKLKPCKLIYQKYLSTENSEKILSLWEEHSSSLRRLQQTANELTKNNHWLLAINTISSELKASVIESIDKHLQMTNLITSKENKAKSLEKILNQVTKVFQWIKSLIEADSKPKFLVVTLSGRQSIVYFDLNIDSINLDYFTENFNFLHPNNTETKEFLFSLLFNNLTTEKSEEIKTNLQLQKKDIIYQIDSQKLFLQSFSTAEKISNKEHHKKRHNRIREFVRLFNKIYFVSKTTKNLNFKQESDTLIKIQNEIRKELQQLNVIYCFKKFIEKYKQTLWKGNSQIEKLCSLFQNEFVQNQRIPEDQISEILEKLEKITSNKKFNSVDSYLPFFAWVYHMVISLLKLPFYNIITHKVLNSESKSQSQFLAVVVTQKFTDPGENSQELEIYLKEMFSFTEHKPIYLNQNDLTVQLTKEPAFVELSLTIKDLQLKQIVDFLNENFQDGDGNDLKSKKQLYLRVDELRKKTNSKGKTQDQQIFLKLISLKDFLKSSEQQFNLQITQEELSFSIECNIVYAPSQISDKTNFQQYLPLNGSSVDSFDDVYMGKHLKLEKLKEWLYTIYISRKSQVDTKNKKLELQNFCNGFIQFHKNNVLPQNKEVLEKVFKNINFQTINKSKNLTKENTLFLPSSLLLKEQCSKNLKQFKQKQYQSKPQIQKLYDLDIKQLAIKLQSQVHSQLQALERDIRVKMEKKIKKLAAQKINKILKKYEAEKQKKTKASKETVGIPPSEQQINPVQEQDKLQTPQGTSTINIHTPITQQPDKDQLMKDLKQKNFGQYLEQKLVLSFQSLDISSQKEIVQQILTHFNEKISKCEHIQPEKISKLLHSKVDKAYQGKENQNKEKIVFIFLLLESNNISYVQLYVADIQYQ